MTALQQRAGNAAATRWVQRATDPLSEHYATRPQQHPEWATYEKLTKAAGIPDDEADAAWQLLLGGVDSQGALNDEAAARTSDRQAQREIRATNSWYHEFVKLMTKHLELKTPTMALWAGGIEVSEYAWQKGHTPLAQTRIGSVLNVLKLHPEWKLTGPMWNILSKAYVSLATGPVHIFVRAYEPDSILIRLEVPHLHEVRRLNPNVQMIWHPLYTGSDGVTREISRDCRLVDNAEYDKRDTCVSVLIQYLRQFHDEDNKKAAPAHKSMKKLLTENGHKDGV
ncbi:hypothetical protein J7I94_06255 [Streptomyces sp. ISL-12]|uniref:hypothetical protein n=1 Tax=Streptomyces sp. ISL-12 TaxID=2819177 RepID=UPI001BE4E732|nr:hypothetical protein [Streptomyces sp. ISL-12]MBT2410160.1 hypothetical protein [Streptomyces sp. ISL-12]